MSGHSELAGTIHSHLRRTQRRAQGVMQLGTVLHTNPWQIELLESRTVLQQDEITLGQWLTAYHAVDQIDPGDTVALIRKESGNEVLWLVIDVFADKTPTPYA
jgi:hypothetical protein